MRAILLILLLLSVQPGALLSAGAAPNAEIDRLIDFVGDSDVRFIRSGKEYSAPEAADHLRKKLKTAGDRVKTTEDFISGIATRSYLTGKPYQVRFQDGRARPAAEWLREQLTQMRSRG